eukprot:2625374-Prymnesium_polylepis.2
MLGVDGICVSCWREKPRRSEFSAASGADADTHTRRNGEPQASDLIHQRHTESSLRCSCVRGS